MKSFRIVSIFVCSLLVTQIECSSVVPDSSQNGVSARIIYDDPDFVAPIGNLTTPIGREAVLSCRVEQLGNYKVGWLKAEDQTVLTLDNRVVTHNSRISVTHDHQRQVWQLHIRQVKESDRGCYMCQVNTNRMKKQVGCVDVHESIMLETESALVKTPWKDFEFLPSNSFPVRSENESIPFHGGEKLGNFTNEFVFNFSLSEAIEIIKTSQRTKILFPEAEIILIIVYAILISSGIISNLLVCFVVTRQCLRKRTNLGSSAPKSRNLYVANLALADLVLCTFCMPFTLVTLIQYEWTFGSLLCKLVPVIQGTNIMVSAGTITAIAFDRYITIVRPPGSRVLYSHSRCKVLIVILIIWIASFAITSPVYFYTVIEPVTFYDILLYEKCIERWPSNAFYTSFTTGFALVQFVIPGMVLVTIHMKISAYLKHHLKPSMEETQPKIEIHSPIEEKIRPENDDDDDDNGKDDSSRKEFLNIRKESVASEDSQKSCDTPRKSSLISRKLSDGSRKESTTNWFIRRGSNSEASSRKRSDFLVNFREVSDFSFHNFGEKTTKSVKSRKRVRRELRRNRRTMFMLSCIAVAYAVSWLPMTIYQVLITQIPRIHQNPKTVYVAFAVCHIFAMSTTITNPLLYGWLNPNFRREFYVIFSSISAFFHKLIHYNQSDSIPKNGQSLAYIDGKMAAPTVTLVSKSPRMQL